MLFQCDRNDSDPSYLNPSRAKMSNFGKSYVQLKNNI